jgi:nicotinamide-nucleotide amidase
LTIGVAESLTGGLLSATIAEGASASVWFAGSVVVYQLTTKQRLLGVSAGPVVSERCAHEMARGVSHLLDADVGLALTGVGGPDPVEGQDPGTVWIAVHTATRSVGRLIKVDGQSPSEVCSITCAAAIDLANEVLELVLGFAPRS